MLGASCPPLGAAFAGPSAADVAATLSERHAPWRAASTDGALRHHLSCLSVCLSVCLSNYASTWMARTTWRGILVFGFCILHRGSRVAFLRRGAQKCI